MPRAPPSERHLSSPGSTSLGRRAFEVFVPSFGGIGVILAVPQVGAREAELFGENDVAFPYPSSFLFKGVTELF